MSESNPYSILSQPTTSAEPEGGPDARALRLAGGLLVTGAVLSFLYVVQGLVAGTGGPAGALGIAIDLVIGVALFRNQSGYLSWAILRTVGGALFFGLPPLFRGDVVEAAVVLVLSAGFLLLLVGKPNRGRIIGGVALAGLVYLLMAVGLIANAFA
ncbi:MAG TPA: hypothetical protein VFS43_45775 [Polyangiaceae bacterium]|nr:hypothetical protein [Polyangiaceae bacterium]